MARYRDALPQLHGRLFLTDGGLETTLIFHDGLDLPFFAAIHALESPEGRAALRRYYETYAELAARLGAGLILEAPTWRGSPDWGDRLGYSPARLAEANRAAIRLVDEVRNRYDRPETPVVVSSCLGPRGDGYVPGQLMTAGEAERYHLSQIQTIAGTEADMLGALTLNYADEAIGIVRAAQRAGMPVAISFTVETDGRLPTGQSLREAVEQVDRATDGAAAYFMVNCAHPSHFAPALQAGEPWADRVLGIRANASRMSHAELNEAPALDAGHPGELAAEFADLKRRLPRLCVLGGCCGTDHRHIEQIGVTCGPLFPAAGLGSA